MVNLTSLSKQDSWLFRPEGRLDSFASWMNGTTNFMEKAPMTTWIVTMIFRAIHFASGEIRIVARVPLKMDGT